MPSVINTAECPNCGALNSSVQNSKPTPDGGRIRRRVCLDCTHSWYTHQAPEVVVDRELVYWGKRFVHLISPQADLPQ
jgi:hypothetical protein